MKRTYVSPFAEKIEFNYSSTVVASLGGDNGDQGIGVGNGGGCDGIDYHSNAKNGGNGVCTGGGNGNGNGSGKTKNWNGNGNPC